MMHGSCIRYLMDMAEKIIGTRLLQIVVWQCLDQYTGKSQKSKMAAVRNLTQISFIFSPLSGTALKGKLICMQLSSD